MPTLVEFILALAGQIQGFATAGVFLSLLASGLFFMAYLDCKGKEENAPSYLPDPWEVRQISELPNVEKEYEKLKADLRSNKVKQTALATNRYLKYLRTACTFLLVSLVLSFLPSINDLWKVRIALIKFQLASPDNLQKGVDTIERVAHHLECKYIGTGCEAPKKEGTKR